MFLFEKVNTGFNTGFQVTLKMEQTNILISSLSAGQQKYLQIDIFCWPGLSIMESAAMKNFVSMHLTNF